MSKLNTWKKAFRIKTWNKSGFYESAKLQDVLKVTYQHIIEIVPVYWYVTFETSLYICMLMHLFKNKIEGNQIFHNS